MVAAFHVALCLLAPLVSGSTLRPPPVSFATRLRGGAEDATDSPVDSASGLAADATAEVPPPAALTKEEIMQKLNGVPTFCVVNKDGGVVGMADAEGGKKSVCWFTDAEEARTILKVMSESNPEAGLQLACHGLGGAFTQCNGWGDKKGEGDGVKTASTPDGDDIELRLQGNHALCKSTGPKLKKLLEDNNLDSGCWQLPIFLCERLASPSIMPIFLHPRDLAAVWEKSGRKVEDLPKDVTVLDIRMLVQQMQTATNPWKIFHIVGPKASIDLANEIEKGEVDLSKVDLSKGGETARASEGAEEADAADPDEVPEVEAEEEEVLI